MPGLDTPFDLLWIDRPDAEAILRRKVASGRVSDTLGVRLMHLAMYGYQTGLVIT